MFEIYFIGAGCSWITFLIVFVFQKSKQPDKIIDNTDILFAVSASLVLSLLWPVSVPIIAMTGIIKRILEYIRKKEKK